MLFSLAVLALLASVQGRAVNISNTWVLPEEGFPVFYRYFRDRISWYEADAVCQFHHANLVTVDTTAQYDAVRAYLKELDISSAVWVGLIRSNPDGDFTWTDYRGLSGDGYWSSAPDTQSAPLCAAADPTADYRWEARACGGPTVASFICELPVPQWALGNEGCMVRALPALTILYLPESAAVQLTADCGMAGVKKVQCTGNVKREDLLKELSCADEEELSNTLSPISTGSNWPMSTDYSLPDQDSTNAVTTEETSTTEHEIDINEHHNITATSLPEFIYHQYKSNQYKNPAKVDNFNKINGIMLSKNVNLAETPDNNIHSNLIPKITDEDTILTNDQLEKLEDERHMKHKMLHEEIARVGNVENIFTQPTDHFIPPLVMAKAKISDDMTVLSLAEKHAQQLAEKQFSKYNLHKASSDHTISESSGMVAKTSADYVDRPLIAPLNTTKGKYSKKEVLKSHVPKKYLSEKHYDVKNKILKSTESKVTGTDHLTEPPSTTFSSNKETDIRTEITNANVTKKSNDDNLEMDLTVMLKDAPFINKEHTSFTGDVAKLETIQNSTTVNYTRSEMPKLDITINKEFDFLTTPETKTTEITMAHEVIKITIIADSDTIVPNTTSFEITTKMPVFIKNKTNTSKINDILTTPSGASHDIENFSTTINDSTTTHAHGHKTQSEPTTTPIIYSTIITKSETENVTTEQPKFDVTTEKPTSTEIIITTGIQNHKNITEDVEKVTTLASTTSLPITTNSLNISLNATNVSNETMENIDGFNTAEYHEILMNMTEHQHDDEEDMDDSDFQSPLLSGAMEPIHRPPRTRRPQQPNRNKFNPFRILG